VVIVTYYFWPVTNRRLCLFTDRSSLHHGGTFVPLYAPILFSQLHIGDNLLDRCVMASVQDRKITEALFILFLAYNVMK